MVRIWSLLIGYAFGLFQTAYFYGKLKGIDIRNYGSGNAGTTNMLRTLGTKSGLIVLLGDVLKTIIAINVVTLLFRGSHTEMIYLLKMYATIGCIIGHNYPLYMHFHGGKGVAVTGGFSPNPAQPRLIRGSGVTGVSSEGDSAAHGGVPSGLFPQPVLLCSPARRRGQPRVP